MTQQEVAAELRDNPQVTIAFDTNAVWGRNLFKTVELVKKLEGLPGAPRPRLIVPAIVHAERVLQISLEKGPDFDLLKIQQVLQSFGVAVVELNRDDAEGIAEHLGSRLSTREGWAEAKRAAVGRTNGNVPATSDFLIAGQAASRDWLLITNDTGTEFTGVPRCTTLAAVQGALDLLLTEHLEPPRGS